MLRLPVALFAVAALVACQKPEPRTLAVTGAWVRLAAVPDRPGAAYFKLAGGETPERLIAVESPRVATIELHAGGMAGGMMTMKPLSGADVPANGQTAFAPGGNHAMLFGVDPSIRPGSALPLTFRFQSGKTLTANATVYAAGDIAPE
jgi:periplasmic copper chaperone A